MILAAAFLVLLWLLLSQTSGFRPRRIRLTDRIMKRGAGTLLLLAAVLVLLRGRIEVALLLLGSGIWLFNSADRPRPPRAVPRPRGPTPSRVRSALLEMELDPATGAMGGTILAGPDEGKRLERMTRAQCEGLYRLCLAADGDGARLLEAYFDRRFAGWRQAGQADGDARRERARRASGMSEEEAYQVLGLARGATREDIVRSHRSLMKKFHPDQGGSTDVAARVNEAKEVLMRRHT